MSIAEAPAIALRQCQRTAGKASKRQRQRDFLTPQRRAPPHRHHAERGERDHQYIIPRGEAAEVDQRLPAVTEPLEQAADLIRDACRRTDVRCRTEQLDEKARPQLRPDDDDSDQDQNVESSHRPAPSQQHPQDKRRDEDRRKMPLMQARGQQRDRARAGMPNHAAPQDQREPNHVKRKMPRHRIGGHCRDPKLRR